MKKIERGLSKLKLGSNANLEENEVVQSNIFDEMLGLPNDVISLNPPCVKSKSVRNNRFKKAL